MPAVRPDQVAFAFVKLADTLVDEFDLIDFLHQVSTHTSEVVGTDAAGILLADEHQRLRFVAATDHSSRFTELFEVQSVEGPGEDCVRLGERVSVEDLRAARGRWPRFAHLAEVAGFASVHAFPLRLRRQVIGALELFGTGPEELSAPDRRVVQALADVATIGILQQRAAGHDHELTEQLHGALHSRVVLEQAKGALAHLRNCTPEEAFVLIQTFARSRQLRLGQVALAVISEPGRYPDLTGPRPGGRQP